MDSEILSRVSTSAGQVLASLGVISATLFWRSSALGEVLAGMGKFSRFSQMLPFTSRLLRLRRFYWIRLLLFVGFVFCFVLCLYSFYQIMHTGERFCLEKAFDPGLMDLLLDEFSRHGSLSGWMALMGTVLMFTEWIVDALCRFTDLDKSLEVFNATKCLERAETRVVEMERYTDMLALWQRRLRCLVKAHPSKEHIGLLNVVGNANIKWSDFSRAVCVFRRFAVNALEADVPKRDGGRDDSRYGDPQPVVG